ncbi:hypothetical protein VTN31DRAFT_2384 [Thermomyces dupontii]|uniref:uncharacterized protein n=1 Tax=Talaromyces thermophilus TaxID=28565 RepID=UPI0037439F55
MATLKLPQASEKALKSLGDEESWISRRLRTSWPGGDEALANRSAPENRPRSEPFGRTLPQTPAKNAGKPSANPSIGTRETHFGKV